MRNYRIPSRLRGSGVIAVNTATLIPAGMGTKLIDSDHREASHAVVGSLIRRGIPHTDAVRMVRRATARAYETSSMRAAEGMGAAGDADPAGQSWLVRTDQIVNEYKDSSYSKSQVHQEAQIAMQGISALLENRIDDLSEQMIGWLYKADDTLDQIQKDTLSASFQSPWGSGAVAFGESVSSSVKSGAAALQKAGQNIADVATMDWKPWVGGGVALAIAAKLAGIL